MECLVNEDYLLYPRQDFHRTGSLKNCFYGTHYLMMCPIETVFINACGYKDETRLGYSWVKYALDIRYSRVKYALPLDGDLGIYKGAIYENIVADIFGKLGKKLYYFECDGKVEIDFFIRKGKTAAAVEVKAADNTKSKSMEAVTTTR